MSEDRSRPRDLGRWVKIRHDLLASTSTPNKKKKKWTEPEEKRSLFLAHIAPPRCRLNFYVIELNESAGRVTIRTHCCTALAGPTNESSVVVMGALWTRGSRMVWPFPLFLLIYTILTKWIWLLFTQLNTALYNVKMVLFRISERECHDNQLSQLRFGCWSIKKHFLI